MTALYRNGLYWVNPAVWEWMELGLLLLDDAGTYAFDIEDLVVADLDPSANELTVDGYERQAVTPGEPWWDSPAGLWRLPAPGVSFGGLGDGVPEDPTVAAAVLFEDWGDDADSPLLAHRTVGLQLDSTDFSIQMSSDGAATVSQAAG